MKFKVGNKRKNGVVQFNSVIPDIINDYQLEKSFTIERIIEKWYDIVGDIISTHSLPDRIYKKILFIAVDHSVYANEIIMMQDSIIEKINEELAFEAVNKIKTDIKNINWKRE